MTEEEQVTVGSPEREIYVKPIAKLEKEIESNQEDNEDEIFKMRSKLYRYFVDSEDGPSWKERGVGDVRILQHKKDKTYRLVMRRDKTLKLCANHQLRGDMVLKSHMESDKSFVWSTPSDYADGECKAETLCIRFGKPEGAAQFKSKFDDCVADLNNNKGSSDSSEKLAKDMSSLKVEDEKDVNDKDSDSKKPEGDSDKTDSKVEQTTKPVENGDAS